MRGEGENIPDPANSRVLATLHDVQRVCQQHSRSNSTQGTLSSTRTSPTPTRNMARTKQVRCAERAGVVTPVLSHVSASRARSLVISALPLSLGLPSGDPTYCCADEGTGVMSAAGCLSARRAWANSGGVGVCLRACSCVGGGINRTSCLFCRLAAVRGLPGCRVAGLFVIRRLLLSPSFLFLGFCNANLESSGISTRRPVPTRLDPAAPCLE